MDFRTYFLWVTSSNLFYLSRDRNLLVIRWQLKKKKSSLAVWLMSLHTDNMTVQHLADNKLGLG